MRRILLCLMAMAQALLAQAYQKDSLFVNVGGMNRNMIVFSPNSKTADMPLFIVTHGMNQDPYYQYNADKMYTMVDTAKFVVTYLRSDGGTWDIGGTKDQDFVLQSITEMKKRFGIDEKRVYWSGFSMGSMLMYHCMPKVLDKIAAFAPTSGIQFSEQPWNNMPGPVNLIHVHAYGDTVFGYEEYGIRDYVMHFTQVDKTTSYKKTTGYCPIGPTWWNGDKELWSGGTNGSEVELFSYNNGGHWPMDGNAREIWNFCKRFSLATPLEQYQRQYKKACEMVAFWENESDINTKTTFRALSNLISTLAPENVDQDNDTKLKSASTRLTTAMANLENTINLVMKSSKRVTFNEFDPNLYIYLGFGQSNMEGNAPIELQDYAGVTKRFVTLSAVNMSEYHRTKGAWYMARPPLCRDNTGLTPLDYFGRAMVEAQPDSITIGVINVALGGCAIEMFDEDGFPDYLTQQVGWLQGYAANYNNNPFRALVNLAKEAQKAGVIKGILLHQGESNNTQKDWPQKVVRIYRRLLHELGLNEEEVPLLCGEMLSREEGGVCHGHNSIIATMPDVLPTARVVSSKGCPGASDGLHFTAEGYRILGRHYAEVMLDFQKAFDKTNAYDIQSLRSESEEVTMLTASASRMNIILTDSEGKEHNVTAACTFTTDRPDLLSFSEIHAITGSQTGTANITATFRNAKGEEASTSFRAVVTPFPLQAEFFRPSLLLNGTFSPISTYANFKTSKGGLGGWRYSRGLDASGYNYLVVDLQRLSVAKPSLRLYDVDDASSESYYAQSFGNQKQLVVDLRNSQLGVDLQHLYMIGFSAENTNAIAIADAYFCMDDPTGITTIPAADDGNKNDATARQALRKATYDMQGRTVLTPRKGVFLRQGKKILY